MAFDGKFCRKAQDCPDKESCKRWGGHYWEDRPTGWVTPEPIGKRCGEYVSNKDWAHNDPVKSGSREG